MGIIVVSSIGAIDCDGALLLGSALATAVGAAVAGTPVVEGSNVGLDAGVGLAVSCGAPVVGIFDCGEEVGTTVSGVGCCVVIVGAVVGGSVSIGSPVGLRDESDVGESVSARGTVVGCLVEASVGLLVGLRVVSVVGLKVPVVGTGVCTEGVLVGTPK